MQTSVETALHMTSETRLDYCMKKSTSGYEHDAGRKEYILTVYMCTVFRLMINSCKIMQDSKSHAITQTIHMNLVGLFCDAGWKSLYLKITIMTFACHHNYASLQQISFMWSYLSFFVLLEATEFVNRSYHSLNRTTVNKMNQNLFIS